MAAELHRWFAGPVVGVSVVVIASGFGQFAATAALGDVAEAFGEMSTGATVADQAGLSGTVLGLGLGIIRLASLASLPLAGLADRYGRRPVLLTLAAFGLAVTASAALSPGYWWFVALFAVSRPFLSGANAVAQVAVAEHTPTAHRVKALALVTAGYALGAGLVAVLRGLGDGGVGFRTVFALAGVPLVLLPLVSRHLTEPERFRVARAAQAAQATSPDGRAGFPVLEALRGDWAPRLLAMVVVAFAAAFVTGPANSFLFVYAENVLGLSPAVMAAVVLAALPTGLVGLLLGRWTADSAGRRVTGGLALAGIAAAGMVTYSGSAAAAVGGYLLAVMAGAAFAPAVSALAAELFPTPVRASVAGWLVATGVLGAVGGLVTFGALADAFDDFGPAAVVVALPALLGTAVLTRLPETRGQELEDSSASPVPA